MDHPSTLIRSSLRQQLLVFQFTLESFAAIDFETANNQRHSVCALGIVIADGNDTTGAIWLVRPPGNRYSTENTALHGLAASDTRSAKRFDEVWPEARKMIGARPVIAHNMEFDAEVLQASLGYYDKPTPRLRKGCSYDMATLVWPDRQSYKLPRLCADLGIDLDHHNALSDAHAAAELVKMMVAIKRCDLSELMRLSNKGASQRREKARLKAMEGKPPTERQLAYLENLLAEDGHPMKVVSAVMRSMETNAYRAYVSRTIDWVKAGKDVTIACQTKKQLKALTGRRFESTSRGHRSNIRFTVR